MSNILVVDDEQSICWAFAQLGEGMGHVVTTAASAEEGLRLAAKSPPDMLIIDVRLPGVDGLSAINLFRRHMGEAPTIVITAFGDLETAVRAVRSGAAEYVIKPFNLAEVRAVIARNLNTPKRVELAAPNELDGEIVGMTPAMQSLFKQIALAAAANANVVVRGESGVGKELAARAVHRYGPRKNAPFVAVNIAALSPTLAESELFGHVDGAFTGSNRTRPGLLAQADGGTLFLDEVADIPLNLQVKLLRALDQGEVSPVGADAPVSTQFRVVAATHQDLQALVREGRFRHDLYYRICAFQIDVPPLRERRDDIPLLASFFASRLHSGNLSLSSEAIAELRDRMWHGNVRELRNAIEHAGVLARAGVVGPEHLPDAQPRLFPAEPKASAEQRLADAARDRARELLNDPESLGAVYDRILQEVETPLLSDAMRRFENECAPAARALGLHRTTLKKKLSRIHRRSDDAIESGS